MTKSLTVEYWPFPSISPILPVELRRQAQKRNVCTNRVAFLLIAVLLAAAVIAFFDYYNRLTFVNLANIARVAFVVVLIFQLYAMISIGPGIVRDIDREFETKQVEFLFVTSLSEREIVLGWLFRHVVPGLTTTFSLFPILATLAIFSSFDLLTLVVIEAALMLAFASSAAIYLYASLLQKSMKMMRTATIAFLLFPAYVLLFQGSLLQIIFVYASQVMFGWMVYIPNPILGYVAYPDLVAAVFGLHPFGLLLSAGELLAPPPLQRLAHPYWLLSFFLLVQMMSCWLFVGLAARRLRRLVIGDAVTKRGWRERVQQLTWRWRPTVWDSNPVLWKELFTGQQLFFASAAALVVLSGIMVGIAFIPGPWQEKLFFLAGFPAMIAHIATTLFATEAMLSERRSRCWELLFLTAIPRRAILSAKLWASLLAAGGLASAALPWLFIACWTHEISWLTVIEYLFGTGVGLYVLAAACLWVAVDAKDLTGGMFWSLLKIAAGLVIYAAAWAVVAIGLVSYGIPLLGIYEYSGESAFLRASFPMLAWTGHIARVGTSPSESLLVVPGMLLYAWLAWRILKDAEQRLDKLSERLPNTC